MFNHNYKSLSVVSFLIVTSYLISSFFVIGPSFRRLFIESIEDEADKIAVHLSSMVVSEHNSLQKKSEIVSPETLAAFMDDFSLGKLKMFSESGEVIYSTEPEDIGRKNNQDYFHEIVAGGGKFTRLVPQGSQTLEYGKADFDILETYVPIIIDDNFIGAFGIYFDITDKRQRIDNGVFYATVIPLFLMIISLAFVMFFFKGDRPTSEHMVTRLAARYNSPFFFLLIITVSIFIAEAAVMWLLSTWKPSSVLAEALFDSSALVMIVSPVLYFALVMPLMSHITMRTRVEEQLRKAHDELEQRVEERTAELETANSELKKEIATRHEYEAQIQLSDNVIENTIEGIMITGINGIIQRVNPSFSLITGYAAKEAIGKSSGFLKSGRHKPEFYREMWHAITKNGTWKGEIWNRRKSGEVYPEWLSITGIKGANGKIAHFVGVFHDISEIKDAERKLSHQAIHDALTGLPNRLLFADRFETALSHAHRHHSHVGLLFVDLDDFKQINDSLGHNMGDIYLCEVAKRIRDSCRDEDTVSRIGGDEFTVVLPNVRDAVDVVELTRRIFRAFSQPVNVNGHSLFISASIGVTIYPDDGTNVEELVKNADIAMYSAKSSGKNKFHLFTPEMNVRANRRMTVENDLRNALEKSEFLVYYQPKIDLANGSIIGAEALLRWQRQNGDIVPPAEFISVAEETSLIIPIGEFVLESVCRQAGEWHGAGYPIRISVNLSMRQFSDKGLVEMVKKVLHKSGFPATALELEITESLLMENEQTSLNILQQLRQEGIKFTIDNFGSGYSSLSYLKKLPIDSLKIDRAFVTDLPGNKDDIAISTAIVSMAESLGLTTVAEGVETMAQYAFLRKLGCTEVQGYFFSPPVAPEEMFTLLTEGKKVELS